MKTARLVSIVACLALVFSIAPAQGVLGKGKGEKSQSGGSQGKSQGSGSSSGGLGRSQGGSERKETGSSTGSLGRSQGSGSSSGSVLDRGRNSGSSSTGRSQGDLGRSQGGDLGRGRESSTTGRREDPITRGSNGGNSQGPLGRIEGRPQDRNRNDDFLGKPQGVQGRSGGSSYGGNNNVVVRENNTRPVEINRLNIDLKGGSLPNQVWREDNPRAYRSGYYQYNNRWCDDNFWYPYYSFTLSRSCTVSPWYYYSNLPAYINIGRITFISGSNCDWGRGDAYQYSRSRSYGGWDTDWDRRSDLDDSIDDLVAAWEYSDKRALGRIISTRGNVGIYMDGRYCYSLSADDFYDLMLDNVYGTETRRYEITSVRRGRDDAQVAARHEFTDAWGRRCTVYHHYRMQRERNGYVITDFLTSDRRTGF